jgi:hypothetical protein
MKKNIFNAVDSADKHGIAVEALIQAEQQFMSGDFDDSELKEALGEDEGFTQMAYKDDDGWWRVTGGTGKFTLEELEKAFPELL